MTLAEYNQTCLKVSQLILTRYSTSFHLGTLAFPREVREAIASIYALTRLADEVVDTFHEYDKAALLADFQADCEKALTRGIATNPVLNAFQLTARQYAFDHAYIQAFFKSMEMDLTLKRLSRSQYEEYVYGSAEVIGLMCLKVFCKDCPERFEGLTSAGRALGSAFQKVNFLRDLQSDLEVRGRIYLPGVNDRAGITNAVKRQIEREVESEFQHARAGIRALPGFTKAAVYATFLHYQALFQKIKRADVPILLTRRLRVSNVLKIFLFLRAWGAVMMGRI